jgi:hypothetical protein
MGRDAQQPVPQAVRARQVPGISQRQVGDDENVTGRGDRRVGVGPQPLGAPAQHCVAMLADHAVEHRCAVPFGDRLPETLDKRGIGLSPLVPGDELRSIHGRSDLPASRMPQQASTCDYMRKFAPVTPGSEKSNTLLRTVPSRLPKVGVCLGLAEPSRSGKRCEVVIQDR